MARSPARRRRLPIKVGYGDGRWVLLGPLVRDAVTGTPYPKRFMIRQRGGYVHAQYGVGGRDRPNDY